MSDNSWIKKAKEHFKEYGGNNYERGDEISRISKEINRLFQELLKTSINDDEIELNLQGNKWGEQGRKKLSDYIWYRAYLKRFGRYYPIVINFTINKDGLDCGIDIYDNSLSDELSKKLLEIIRQNIDEDNSESSPSWRKNDYGYFNIENKNTFQIKLEQIIKIYKKLIPSINETIFNEMIDKYKYSSSSRHCQINENDEHYRNRKKVKGLVDEFVNSENPTKDQFGAFWNRNTINSAQQASNATNIINRNGSTNDLQGKVKNLIHLPRAESSNKELLEDIQNQIESSRKSSLELYYYYHMENDEFPLINGGIENAMKIISKNNIIINGDDIVEKMTELKERMKNKSLERFYLLDQFLNLIDKIKYEDIKDAGSSKELYQLAYLFTFFRKVKSVGNASFFDELLKKTKNIILYGAPGTGKTYTSMMNISRIIEEDFINDKIDPQDRLQIVQFHPSYGYEDFMEGLKPIIKDNQVVLELQKGNFMKFCEVASEFEKDYNKEKDKEKMKYAFFFLIDEINRAELSRVFGEIMFALDKRGNKIQTQYSYMKDENKEFSIPNNVYFIGTMNDVDRSIDSFDIALRRRFFWYRMDCDYGVIQDDLLQFNNIGTFNDNDIPNSGYIEACFKLNQYITKQGEDSLGLGKLYELGHSYFMNIKLHADKKKIKNKDLENLFDFSIAPLLKEYVRAEYSEDQIENKVDEAKKIFKLPKEQ